MNECLEGGLRGKLGFEKYVVLFGYYLMKEVRESVTRSKERET